MQLIGFKLQIHVGTHKHAYTEIADQKSTQTKIRKTHKRNEKLKNLPSLIVAKAVTTTYIFFVIACERIVERKQKATESEREREKGKKYMKLITGNAFRFSSSVRSV